MNQRIVCLLMTLLAILLGSTTGQARCLNSNTGRFQTMDSYEGNNHATLSLHKYLYGDVDPVNKIDPSGKNTLIEEETVAGNTGIASSQVGRGIARRLAKNFKEREWMIWRVQLKNGIPWMEHTFVWAENFKTKRGIGYHALAEWREMPKAIADFIPGLFVILPQQQADKFGPVELPVVSKVPVMILTKKQFVVWNALSVGFGALEMVGETAYGGFPYSIPDSTCKTWTQQAIRNALFVGSVPF